MATTNPLEERAQSYRRDIRALDTQISDLETQLADVRSKPCGPGTIKRIQTELTRAKAQRFVKQKLLAALFAPRLFDPVTNAPLHTA